MSMAKTEALSQNRIDKAVRSSSLYTICDGFASARYHLVRGSGLGLMRA